MCNGWSYIGQKLGVRRPLCIDNASMIIMFVVRVLGFFCRCTVRGEITAWEGTLKRLGRLLGMVGS